MVDHIKQQLADLGQKPPQERLTAGQKGKTKGRPSDVPTAAEIEARAEVVGVGRLAWENPIFGLPAFYRKYRLLTAQQAAALDVEFYRITHTQP